MKTLFACLLALCLAVPACAAEEEDGELFSDNAIVIVLDEDMDNKELEKSVKAILQRLKSGDVLGSAAKSAKIYAMSDIDLGEFYSRKEYPALDKYRDDLSKLNSRLYAIIATDAFAAQGINAPEAKEWRRQCFEAQKRYAKAKLPPRRNDAFAHLNSAAGYYSALPRSRNEGELLRVLQTLEIHRKYVDTILEQVSIID